LHTGIEEDARDPHFAAKLSQLGQVRVDHHMKEYNISVSWRLTNLYALHNLNCITQSARASRMLKSRLHSEDEAFNLRSSSAPKNRILASDLLDLLHQRQISASNQQLRAVEEAAIAQGLDKETLTKLARYVAAPEVEERNVIRHVGEDGMERATYKVGAL
jgi:hypothetical protein